MFLGLWDGSARLGESFHNRENRWNRLVMSLGHGIGIKLWARRGRVTKLYPEWQAQCTVCVET